MTEWLSACSDDRVTGSGRWRYPRCLGLRFTQPGEIDAVCVSSRTVCLLLLLQSVYRLVGGGITVLLEKT